MSRRYPITPPDQDHRFTFGLVLDVAKVLAAHDYPPITADIYDGNGADLFDLQTALFRFLYARTPRQER